MSRPGRNEVCPCGSGKKFKHCCESKKTGGVSSRLILLAVAGAILAAIFAGFSNSREGGGTGRVWSAEHGHYHDAGGGEGSR